MGHLQCNRDHGRHLTNTEKQKAFAAYIEHGLHLYGDADFPIVPGTLKSLRTIAAECPVYDFRTIGKKLKELGINAPRDDVKAFVPYGDDADEDYVPSAEEMADEQQIALTTFRQRLDEVAASFALLDDQSRNTALSALDQLVSALRPPSAAGTSASTPLEI